MFSFKTDNNYYYNIYDEDCYELPINRFLLNSKKKIGEGAFGKIYEGRTMNSDEEVAMKLELDDEESPQLEHESKILDKLENGGNYIIYIIYIVGFPYKYWYGIQGRYKILVMELLGPNLEDLFDYCNRTFSLKTTLICANQIVYILYNTIVI